MNKMQYRASSPIVHNVCKEDWKPGTQDWCVTEIKVRKFTFAWTITNFSVCSKMRECLESSPFPSDGNFQWCLRLTFKERNTFYNIHLNLVNPLAGKTRAGVKFYFLNSKGEKFLAYETINSIFFADGQEDGYTYRFTKDDLVKNNSIYNDIFTIVTEVSVIADKTNKTNQTYMASFKEPECKLIDNFQSILDQEKFCDVTLVINDIKLQAHKAILAARSIVFAAMFDSEMLENTENVVTITDINLEAFKEMLHFMYTGKAPKIDVMAMELLPAADKYALGELKSLCEVALYRNLTVENAAEILILADLHKAKQLKMHAISFIKIYATNVVKTEGWKNLIETHPILIAKNNLNI